MFKTFGIFSVLFALAAVLCAFVSGDTVGVGMAAGFSILSLVVAVLSV